MCIKQKRNRAKWETGHKGRRGEREKGKVEGRGGSEVRGSCKV